MSELLIISDNLPRSNRLVRTLNPACQCRVHDLYIDVAYSISPGIIVGDIAKLSSEAIMRLRRILESVREAGAPLLFLIHGNVARAEALTRLFNANDTLPASSGFTLLQDKIDQLLKEGKASAVASKLATEARQFLIQSFSSGATVTPELATAGTTLIARAVQQSGVREWIQAVQRFDEATQQHCLMVTGLSAAFATRLGFGDLDSYRLTEAALLHDVGKMRIPLSILNKPGRLTRAETAVMRTHATVGYDMLRDGGFSQDVLRVVRSHHELLDGSGYPEGLMAPDIPDLVRLVTICDIYGALIERRPYRAPMSGREAYTVLQSMTGKLDLDLVKSFQSIVCDSSPVKTPNIIH